jgi:hypothetical protein
MLILTHSVELCGPSSQAPPVSAWSAVRHFLTSVFLAVQFSIAGNTVKGITVLTVGESEGLDTRQSWGLAEKAELGIMGENLPDPRHPELHALSQFFVTTQAKRSVYGKITWWF